MKKKLLIIITVLLVVVMTATFAACKKNINEEDIFNAASYTTDNGETSREVQILVRYGSKTVYDSTDVEKTDEAVKDQMASIGAPLESKFNGTGTGLSFSSDYFANSSITRGETTTEYVADITAISTFLGVSDCSNGKITIIVTNEKAALSAMKITYTTAQSFEVEINVTMKY